MKSKVSIRDRFCTNLVTNQASSTFSQRSRSRSSDRISLSRNQGVHDRRRSRSLSRSSQSSNRNVYHRKRSRSSSRSSQSSRQRARKLQRSRSQSRRSESSRQCVYDLRRSRSPRSPSRFSQPSKKGANFRRRSRSSDIKCPSGSVQNKRKNQGFSQTFKDKFSAPLLTMKGVCKRSKSKIGRRSRSPSRDHKVGNGKENSSRARLNSILKQTRFEATNMRRSRSPSSNSTSSFKYGKSPGRSRSRFQDRSISPWKNPHNNQRNNYFDLLNSALSISTDDVLIFLLKEALHL